MIIIFSGNGKGKTSAAMGTSLRAIAHKRKVSIVQFLKPGDSSEIKLLKTLSKSRSSYFRNLTVTSWGKKTWTYPDNLTEEDFLCTDNALRAVKTAVSKNPFLLIIDEILVALKFKLLTEEIIFKIIDDCKKRGIHLILTGRGSTKQLEKRADLVTEMENVKHPFDKGTQAVLGIDF